MFNLALVSRSEEKLNKVRDEVSQIDSKVEVKVIPVDLADCPVDRYRKIFTEDLEGKQVNLLFNNAGKLTYKFSLEADPNEIEQTIKLNTYPMALLSSAVYSTFKQQLKENAHQNLGIFQVSSFGSPMYVPMLGIYCAGKRFNDIFGKTFDSHV